MQPARSVSILLILLLIGTASAQKVVLDVPGNVKVGDSFKAVIYAQNVDKLAGFDFFIIFNPKVIRYESYKLPSDVPKFSVNYGKSKGENVVEIAALTTSPATDSVSGNVELLEITFKVVGEGASKINFDTGSKLVRYANGKLETYPNVIFTQALVSTGVSGSVATTATATAATTATTVTTATTATTAVSTTATVEKTATAAITTVAGGQMQHQTQTQTATVTATVTTAQQNGNQNQVEQKTERKTPGFEIAFGILALSLGIVLGRKRF